MEDVKVKFIFLNGIIYFLMHQSIQLIISYKKSVKKILRLGDIWIPILRSATQFQ